MRIALLIALHFPFTATGQTLDHEIVVATGLPAPSLPADTVFERGSTFFTPILSPDGTQVFFDSELSGPSITWNDDNRALWLWDQASNTHTLIEQSGHPTSEPSGAEWRLFWPRGITDSGELIFRASLLVGTGNISASNDVGLWKRTTTGSSELIAREGDPVPGDASLSLGDVRFDSQDLMPGVSTSGNLIFHASIGSNSDSLFGPDLSGNLVPLVIAGESIPEGSNMLTIDGVGQEPIVNDAGDFAAMGFRSGNGYVVGRGSTGAPEALISGYDTPPGSNAGSFHNFGQNAFLSLDASGTLTLRAAFWEGSDFRWGLWQSTDGGFTKVIFSGEVIPGFESEGYILDVIGRPTSNVNGEVAFLADVNIGVDSNGNPILVEAVLTNVGGSWSILAMELEEAPETDGARFSKLLPDMAMNDAGQVIFNGQLLPASPVTSDNDSGIWMWDPTHGHVLLLREGDTFEVAPGDSRAIDVAFLPVWSQHASGGHDGHPRGTLPNLSVIRVKFKEGKGMGILLATFDPTGTPGGEDTAEPGTDTAPDADTGLGTDTSPDADTNPPADTSPGMDTAPGTDTASPGEDTTTPEPDTTVSADTATAPDTALPPSSGEDDCACQIRVRGTGSGMGWLLLLGGMMLLGHHRRRTS